MKIFSNFDTKHKFRQFEEKKQEYWASNVFLLSKSKLFRFLSVDMPFGLWVAASLFLLWVFNAWLGKNGVLYGALPLMFITLIAIAPKTIKHIIDYNMDFIIITPKTLYRYDQEGLIKRDIITINTHSIKSVTVRKWWWLYSIFDNWDIIFLTEGDASFGEITLTYIKDPERERSRIGKVIKSAG